jgi:cardiolipin synthase
VQGLRRWLGRICWIASGPDADPAVAFDWVAGRVGSRQNPDGMRSVLHTGAALAVLCALVDLILLARHDWVQWALYAFLHLAWVVAILVLTALNVGFLESPDGQPLHSVGGPNTLTLARGFLVPVLVYLILRHDYRAAAFGYAAITSSDAIDGWWARKHDLRSKLGIVLDPVVDLLLHLAVFIALVAAGLLGRLALVLILLRSGLLAVGTGGLHWWKGRVRIQPTPLGKCTGLLLALATLALLALAGYAPERGGALGALRLVVSVLLTLSVLHVLAIGAINLSRPTDRRAP